MQELRDVALERVRHKIHRVLHQAQQGFDELLELREVVETLLDKVPYLGRYRVQRSRLALLLVRNTRVNRLLLKWLAVLQEVRNQAQQFPSLAVNVFVQLGLFDFGRRHLLLLLANPIKFSLQRDKEYLEHALKVLLALYGVMAGNSADENGQAGQKALARLVEVPVLELRR